jgi:acyl carrier protein
VSASLQDRVLKVLTEVAPDIDPSTLQLDMDLRDQLDFDSMDTLSLAIGLKRELGVDIPDRDFKRLANIKDCLAYLQLRLQS